MSDSSAGGLGPSILLVDDERTARLSLAEILRMEGYQVVAAEGGTAAIQALQARDFDLVLCDLKMPDVDGLEVMEVCRELRPATEFVLLTAYGTLDTAVEALRHGASDYLLKPALPDTILASLNKALEKRRQAQERQSLMGVLANTLAAIQQSEGAARPATGADESLTPSVLRGRGIVLDLERRSASQDGIPLSLTPTEYDLLAALMRADGRPIPAEELVVQVQGYLADGEEARSLIRVHISRLRQKIEVDPAEPRIIVTVRGVGYAFGGADVLEA